MRRAIVFLILSACGTPESGDGAQSATNAQGESAQPSSDTGADATSSDTGADATSADTGADATSADTTATGGAPVDLGPCARLLDCVDALDSQPITPLIAAYGPAGTCWAEFEAEACWQDCGAALQPLAGECSGEPKCCECMSDSDCSDLRNPSCSPEGACGPVPEPDCSPLDACGDKDIQINVLMNLCADGSTCSEGQLESMIACVFSTAEDTAEACSAASAAVECAATGNAAGCGPDCLDEIVAVDDCL